MVYASVLPSYLLRLGYWQHTSWSDGEVCDPRKHVVSRHWPFSAIHRGELDQVNDACALSVWTLNAHSNPNRTSANVSTQTSVVSVEGLTGGLDELALSLTDVLPSIGPHARRAAYFYCLGDKTLSYELAAANVSKTQTAMWKLLFPVIK